MPTKKATSKLPAKDAGKPIKEKPMPPATPVDHFVPLAKAQEMVKNARHFAGRNPIHFSRAIIEEILRQPGCTGLRVYDALYGNTVTYVLTGVDSKHNDVYIKRKKKPVKAAKNAAMQKSLADDSEIGACDSGQVCDPGTNTYQSIGAKAVAVQLLF